MHVQLFTVCTELMLSVHRADCERATQPYSSVGGRYDFSRLKTSQALPHTSVLIIECFLTRSMLFLKCIYTCCRDIPDNGLDNKNNTKLRYKFHKFFLSKVPAQCKTIILSENDRDMATLLETP